MASKQSTEPPDWLEAFKPLFKKFKGRKHPLNHVNLYQLVVAVILSAQDSDRHINEITPALFERYPSMKELAKANPHDLDEYLTSVRNFRNKVKWLLSFAQSVRDDKNIPTTLDGLIALPGIGRKSANVIISETGGDMEGVIVDLHVVRDAPRIGIAVGTNPEKIEKQLMEKFPKKYWRELGMSLTFLGREICRPTNPHCSECPMNPVCAYYKNLNT